MQGFLCLRLYKVWRPCPHVFTFAVVLSFFFPSFFLSSFYLSSFLSSFFSFFLFPATFSSSSSSSGEDSFTILQEVLSQSSSDLDSVSFAPDMVGAGGWRWCTLISHLQTLTTCLLLCPPPVLLGSVAFICVWYKNMFCCVFLATPSLCSSRKWRWRRGWMLKISKF